MYSRLKKHKYFKNTLTILNYLFIIKIQAEPKYEEQ